MLTMEVFEKFSRQAFRDLRLFTAAGEVRILEPMPRTKKEQRLVDAANAALARYWSK